MTYLRTSENRPHILTKLGGLYVLQGITGAEELVEKKRFIFTQDNCHRAHTLHHKYSQFSFLFSLCESLWEWILSFIYIISYTRSSLVKKKTIHSHKITALWSNTLFTQSQYSIFLSCISMWILMGMNGWKRNLHYLIHAFISGSKRRPIREGWTQFGCNRADLWPFCSTPPYCQIYVHCDNTIVGL